MNRSGTNARFRLSSLLLAAAPIVVVACGEDAVQPAPAEPPVPTTVTVGPTSTTLRLPAETVKLAVSVRDQYGNPMVGVTVSWKSSDSSVAAVDGTGLVTAVAIGTTTVTATAGSASGSAEVTVEEHPDRAALVALYNGADGPNWLDNNNWLTDAPLGEWFGVRTDRSGRVTEIDLAGDWDREAEQPVPHGLRGPIPPELGDLARLEVLDLGNNALWGPIPPELGTLTNLELLELGRNNLEGRIPTELGRLANLESLNLSHSGVEGPIPSELGELVNLRRLYLGWNALAGPIPPELASLTQLVHLDLSGNDLEGRLPSWLGNLANLTHLKLDRNDFSGPVPPELGLLNRLESLWLHGNAQLSGPFPHALVNLPLDAFTWACGTRAVCAPGTPEFVNWLGGIGWTVDGPFCNASDQAVLSNLFDATGGDQWTESAGWLGGPALEEWHGVRTDSSGSVTDLELSENGLSGGLPDEIAELTRLTRLRIDGNELSGRLPLSLTALALDEFDYAGTELCEPADDSFQAWLHRIPAVKGTGTQCAPLTDRDRLVAVYEATGGPKWARDRNWLTRAPLGSWHGVEVDGQGRVVGLSLGGNGLSGVIPPEIAGLSSLRSLRFSWGDLSGRIPKELGDLANLENLDLTGNGLEGAIPPELGRLSGLHTLSLGRNHLSGPIPEELGDLVNLVHLDLSRNDLSGAIPSALGRLSGLRGLFLSENDLSGPLPRALGRLARLVWLDLVGNDLSGAIPAELGNLARLERLKLARNRHDGRIPPELGDLTNVKYLSLSENDLAGAIPPELGSLTNLESIYLSENELSGPLPAQFGKLSRLRTLDLKGNPALSGPLPASVTDLRLETLQAGDTDLCLPREPAFETWLETIPTNWIALCGGAMAYLVQTVQSRTHPVPLVAGRRALLRVFVTATRETNEAMPPVRARFYLQGTEQHVVDLPGTSGSIPAEVVEGDLAKSANVEIPGRIVSPGLEMVIDIDPEGTLDPGLGVPKRIPETGRLAVDVRQMPVFDLTLIPFIWSEAPDSVVLEAVDGMAADPDGHRTLQETRSLLPVGRINVTAHEPVVSTSWGTHNVLPQVSAIRALEGGRGYYMGLASGRTTPIPRAVVGGRVSVSDLRPEAIAHELGHNMSLWHAPCGNAPGPDPSYPYPGGLIGAWGYDFRDKRLARPGRSDIMGYCNQPWMSDYHFTKALEHRLRDEASSASPVAGAATMSLLLWGGIDAEGQPFLNPAFVADAPARLPDSSGDWGVTGRDSNGEELFSLRFAMPVVLSEEDEVTSSFAYALPVQSEWASALSSITLSGPGGSVALDGDADRPMAILRNPLTGQVRGFLDDPPQAAEAAMDVAWRATEPGLAVLFSRGIPDTMAWRR